MPTYRLRVALTYTTTANATNGLTAINNALTAQGRAEVATRSGRDVALLIPGGMTEGEAIPLVDAIVTAANVGAKSGKISTVRTQ